MRRFFAAMGLLCASCGPSNASVDCGVTHTHVSGRGVELCLPSRREFPRCAPGEVARVRPDSTVECVVELDAGDAATDVAELDAPDAFDPAEHTHYYPSLEAAEADGLVSYYPMSEDRGDAVFDAVQRVWTTFTGDWFDPDYVFHERHGPAIRIDAATTFQPALPAHNEITLLLVVASPSRVGHDAPTRVLWHSGADCMRSSASLAFGDPCPGSWCVFARAGACPGDRTEPFGVFARTEAETATEVVYAFFLWSEDRVAWRIEDVEGSVEVALAPYAHPIMGDERFAGFVTSYAVWNRLLTNEEMNAIRGEDSELVDHF